MGAAHAAPSLYLRKSNKMSDEYTFHVITNVPNTTLKSVEGVPPRFTELTGMFEVLLLKLHRRHKNWRFIITPSVYSYQYAESSNSVASIKVYDHGTSEVLGEISRHGEQYSVTNFRIKREGKRSDERRSVNLNKIVQVIEKYFIPKDVTESLRDVSSSTSSTIDGIRQQANMAMHRAVSALMHDDTLAAFVLPNLEEIVAAVRRRNVGAADRIQSIPELIVHATDADTIKNAKTAGEYYTVMIRSSDQYVVVDEQVYAASSSLATDGAGTDGITTYTAETLPPLLRGRVGMLKLTDVGALIPGVGVRTGTNAFFVLKKV